MWQHRFLKLSSSFLLGLFPRLTMNLENSEWTSTECSDLSRYTELCLDSLGKDSVIIKAVPRSRDVFPQLGNSASLKLQQEAEFRDRLMESHYVFWLRSLSFVVVVWEHRACSPPGREGQWYLHFVHYAEQVIAHFPISWLLFILIHPSVEPFPRPSWSVQSPGL